MTINCKRALGLFLAVVLLLGTSGIGFLASPRCMPSRDPEGSLWSRKILAEAEAARKQSMQLRSEAQALEAELQQRHTERKRGQKERMFVELVGQQAGMGSEALLKLFGNGVSTQEAYQVLELYGVSKDGRLPFEQFEPDKLQEALEFVRSGQKVIHRRVKAAKEQVKAKQDFVASLPEPNTDFSTQSRCLAVLPYLLPLVTALSLAAEEYPIETVPLVAVVSLPLLSSWYSWHWILALWMSRLANKRRLPLVQRFNIQQAFTLDLLLVLGACLCSWFSGPTKYADVHVLDQVVKYRTSEPRLELEGMLLCVLGCILYSTFATLLGSIPDGIFFVSDQARRSLGRMRPTPVGIKHCPTQDEKI